MKRSNHTGFDVVTVACSYGAIQSLQPLLATLPSDFPATILVAYHATHPSSFMVEILQKITKLPVAWAEDGEAVLPGRVVVAPPDQHLL